MVREGANDTGFKHIPIWRVLLENCRVQSTPPKLAELYSRMTPPVIRGRPREAVAPW
jgi:hypothetical protein